MNCFFCFDDRHKLFEVSAVSLHLAAILNVQFWNKGFLAELNIVHFGKKVFCSKTVCPLDFKQALF